MKIVKLNATDSTNLYLKNLMNSESLEDLTVVVAKKQLKGRGQMGAKWESESGKNLTFSVLKRVSDIPISNQFILNICVSLGIYKVLKSLQIPSLTIKWPNDILSGNQKICGILIENILAGANIQASIIGIGINVNQLYFKNLPKATSLKRLLGKTLDLDEVLASLVDSIEKQFSILASKSEIDLRSAYQRSLFRKDKPSTFKNKDGELFMGFIKGVSDNGKLKVALEDNILTEFNLKEIQLLY